MEKLSNFRRISNQILLFYCKPIMYFTTFKLSCAINYSARINNKIVNIIEKLT